MDGRGFNFRKGINLQHKLRLINPGNKTGESYGITIPTVIASQFQECWMRIYTSGNAIILESGCKMVMTDVDVKKKFCYDGMRQISNGQGQMEFVK
jgi:hypothetical protein